MRFYGHRKPGPGHHGRKWKLLPIAQFDDPTVCLQTQALHHDALDTEIIGEAR
jgi:hypothetical protein